MLKASRAFYAAANVVPAGGKCPTAPTAVIVDYIDAYRSRFEVGPIATDDFLHDLGATAKDGLGTRIHVRLGDRVLLHVPVAAVQMPAPVGQPAGASVLTTPLAQHPCGSD